MSDAYNLQIKSTLTLAERWTWKDLPVQSLYHIGVTTEVQRQGKTCAGSYSHIISVLADISIVGHLD